MNEDEFTEVKEVGIGADYGEVEGVRRSARAQTFSEKGLEYQQQSRDSMRRRACRQLMQKTDIISAILDDADSSSCQEVRLLYSHWMTLYEVFLDAHEEYHKLFTDESVERDIWFQEKAVYIEHFRASVDSWFMQQAKSRDIKVEVHASAVDGKSSRSVRSVTRSNRLSHVSSVSTARIKEEQRIAELKIKAAALDKKNALAHAKLKLQQDIDRLGLEEEMAIAGARSKVLDAYEERQTLASTVSHHSLRRGTNQREFAMPTSSIKSGSRGHSDSDNHSDDSCKSTQAALMSVVRHLNKPQVEISKFDGNPLMYRKFMRQFQTRIVNNTDDDDEKMTYLEQLTTGEVHKIVRSFSHLDASIGYEAVLRELEDRYGDNETIAGSFIKKVLKWPNIKANDSRGLDEFSVFLCECENAVKCIDSMRVLEYPDNMKQIICKLPYHLHDRWRNIVLQAKDHSETVDFHKLAGFVKREAKKVNHPTYGREAMASDQPDGDKKSQLHRGRVPQKTRGSYVGVAKTTRSDKGEPVGMVHSGTDKSSHGRVSSIHKPCVYCEDKSHPLWECQKFKAQPFNDRISYLRSNGFCFGCLRLGHQKSNCRNKATCNVCERKHPTVLHIEKTETPLSTSTGREIGNTVEQNQPRLLSHMGAGSHDSAFAVVPVRVLLNNGPTHVDTYAFLDPGSNVSFCTENLMNRLGGHGKKVNITMDTMGVSHTMDTFRVKGLQICGLDSPNDHVIELPEVFTKEKMPVNRNHIPTYEDISEWPHLDEVTLPQIESDVDLLIGYNVPDAYAPLEVKIGPRGSPHAVRSLIGWILWSIVRREAGELQVNQAEVIAISETEELRQLNQLYEKSVNMEFPERISDDRKENSQEDHAFLQKVESSMKLVDGHHELCLPFRDDRVQLPDNSGPVLQRLHSLKKKMIGNPQFYSDYKGFISGVISNGYAIRVPEADLARCDGRVWYLPHHGIYHPKKPDKIRVVFDCAATTRGVSLNSVLLQGPDLTNKLVGVLLRFREEAVGVMGDIDAMFHQVRVPEYDQDCLRFYWWPDGNLDDNPAVFRMVVHLFGAVSSPTCCNLALQKTAEINRSEFGNEVSDVILHNFYVDDLLKSVDSEARAVTLVQDVSELCLKGGFRLRKWISNNRTVMKSVPDEDLRKDLCFDTLPVERALGVCWNVENDTFGFNVTVRNSLPTRRNLLSIVCSVYDPLGLAAPFVLLAKILLQDLCLRQVDWDTELSGADIRSWQQWLTDLPKLENMSIPRCVRKPDFGDVESTQLHLFSGASDVGYGVVAYLRFTNQDGAIHCSLLYSRARVAPLKKMTTPRLELTAATLAVKTDTKLRQELDIDIDSTYFWMDSMAVIRYIANKKTRFHTFVANRLAVIHECSDLKQWRHVESKSNPADIVSRGITVDDLLRTKYWIYGPCFLYKPELVWPGGDILVQTCSPDDPEVKRCVNTVVTTRQDDLPLATLVKRYSSWIKLRRVLGCVILYMKKLQSWSQKRKGIRDELSHIEKDPNKLEQMVTVQMSIERAAILTQCKDISLDDDILVEAEKKIFRFVQLQYYPEEVADLSSRIGHVKKRSPLHRLDPIMSDGIIRVGGRLGRSVMEYEAQHQVILPGDSEVSKLLLMKTHRDVGHLGRNTMQARLRQYYWIIGASAAIRRLLSKCIICIKYRCRSMHQKMADLPVERITPDEPVFSTVGVDYFGPLQVKRGRAVVKRYGVLFTCLVTRAVHLEVAYSLDADSCINAIRRFIARRGTVKLFRSDNGTNLVGAEREMREDIAKWNQHHFQESLLQHAVTWVFNPPSASHFGGVWERLIRSVRKILFSLMKEQMVRLDDESLQTLFCEVESIMNSRPITSVSSDPNDLDVLTPNHLLLLQPGRGLPCGTFSKADNYSRRRWLQIQYLSNIFWSRWRREYLPLLQERQKWLQPQRNVTVGDLVLIMDNTPRNAWTLGRVLSTIPDNKGLVRVVTIKTATSTLQRPIHKLCLVLEADLDSSNKP